MNRNTRIASLLGLAGCLCVSLAQPALAAGPLLSGYGGPGAGEQAILGATLLGGHRGGSGSGRPADSQTSGGAVPGSSSATVAGGSTRSRSSGTGGTVPGGTSPPGSGGAHGSSGTRGSADRSATHGSWRDGERVVVHAYVYPSSLRLASADSSALAISGGEALLTILAIATLALVGVLTVRLSRLQR
ncbi:MAG TPA: hypothetical protein VN845_09010 [Solirubrobacteraceae bacterium]|nr:hypothetical protein [Solirubrobacteraceae bacterium]